MTPCLWSKDLSCRLEDKPLFNQVPTVLSAALGRVLTGAVSGQFQALQRAEVRLLLGNEAPTSALIFLSHLQRLEMLIRLELKYCWGLW